MKSGSLEVPLVIGGTLNSQVTTSVWVLTIVALGDTSAPEMKPALETFVATFGTATSKFVMAGTKALLPPRCVRV